MMATRYRYLVEETEVAIFENLADHVPDCDDAWDSDVMESFEACGTETEQGDQGGSWYESNDEMNAGLFVNNL